MLGMRGIPSTYGGIEKSVEEISVRLAARGHRVVAYCRTTYCSLRPPEYGGVDLRYLPAIDTKHLEAITHSAVATAVALTRGYDVIHIHGTGPSLFAPVARASRAKVVVSVQGLDYQRDKWGRAASLVLRAGAWTAAHSPDATIVVSRELEKHFEDVYGRDVIYVPNGVNLPHHAVDVPPFDLEPERYFLFIGRLVPEKAIHLLLEGYRRTETDFPLIVAGLPSHSDSYARQLSALAARDGRVRLVGPVYGAQKQALLANAYAFCQPSRLEGLPIALLEALAYSRCAIASDLPEHLEVLGGSPADSFVFRTGDVGALATALRRALNEPARVAEAGRAGRSIAERKYQWDSIVDRIEDVYRSVIAPTSPDPARAAA